MSKFDLEIVSAAKVQVYKKFDFLSAALTKKKKTIMIVAVTGAEVIPSL